MNIFEQRDKTKAMAIVMVSCLLIASIGGMALEDEPEEVEAIVWLPLVVNLLGLGATAVVAGYAGYKFGHSVSAPSEDYTRTAEASVVAAAIKAGITYFDNALANYEQIWTFTNPHWIRQTELAASSTWEKSQSFNPDLILENSGVYLNSSHMIYNAGAQVSTHFESIGSILKDWNKLDLYGGMMKLQYSYGSSDISTTNHFDGNLVTTTKVTSDNADTVYLTKGDFWVFGGSATITSSDGTTIQLTEGLNNLVNSGIYELQKDRSYAGTILSTYDEDHAGISAGFVATAGTDTKLITYSNGKAIVDGTQHSDFKLKIIPEGGTAQVIELLPALADFDSLIKTIQSVMGNAVSGAITVWDIFNKAGSASAYLTTLMIPNNYHNMDVSQAQKEVMTILAMEQLAEYYDSNAGEIKKGEYQLSDKSLQLFARGNIIDEAGRVLYENAIFTPFYYSKDQTLNNGNNAQTQSSIIAIWTTEGTNLSGWDSSTNINQTTVVTLDAGSNLYVSEMIYGGQIVNTVDLELHNIDIIEGTEFDKHNPLPSLDGELNLIKWALLILGMIAVIGGFWPLKNIWIILIGAGIFATGLILGDFLWGLF